MAKRLEKQLELDFMEKKSSLLNRAGKFYISLPERISNISYKEGDSLSEAVKPLSKAAWETLLYFTLPIIGLGLVGAGMGSGIKCLINYFQ